MRKRNYHEFSNLEQVSRFINDKKLKRLFFQKYVRQMPHNEIAKESKISRETVRQHLAKLNKLLIIIYQQEHSFLVPK